MNPGNNDQIHTTNIFKSTLFRPTRYIEISLQIREASENLKFCCGAYSNLDYVNNHSNYVNKSQSKKRHKIRNRGRDTRNKEVRQGTDDGKQGTET
jgi:hypothetical protein